MMLNASDNTKPRDVNVGLPASVGGTTILENGLPVVFFFWPEMPYFAWAVDATTNGFQTLDLGQTAINVGDVGFAVGTFDNLGTPDLHGAGSINSNHFGLLRPSLNISGPLGSHGLKFSVGGYVSLDPGTFKASDKIDRFHSEQTQLYKAALSQDYKKSWGSGSIAALYKYANTRRLGLMKYSPVVYHADGSVTEYEYAPGKNFSIGRDSYYEETGRVKLQDGTNGKSLDLDLMDDYATTSHTIDLIGKNTLNSGLNVNYTLRYHNSHASIPAAFSMGVSTPENGTYYSAQNGGSSYNGKPVQSMFLLASRPTPIQSFTSVIEIGKKSGNHDWKIGFNEWYYNIDKFSTETAIFYQTVEPNPKLLYINTGDAENGGFGDGYYFKNSGLEYHNGHEFKHALFAFDKWQVTKALTINAGVRLEAHIVRGDYINKEKGFDGTLNSPKTKIKDNWYDPALTVNSVYNLSKSFGLLLDLNYNQVGGQLENYSSGVDPQLEYSHIPGAGLGLFLNSPWLSLISKATYIQRDNYRSTINFANPKTPGDSPAREMAHYDVRTIGWTTDAIVGPFNGFALHYLLTIQNPTYQNFSGTLKFNAGNTENYNFDGKIVSGISQVLMEIDPSYTWKDLRLWASARYFSKQTVNRSNTLYIAPRWETFAGVNYQINSALSINATVVNLLNQSGISGSVDATDLYTEEQAKKYVENGLLMTGTYIRPFTIEFGLKYNF
jgi:hypothetical protein